MTATVQIIKTAEKSLGSVSLERSFIWWKKKAYLCVLFFFVFCFFHSFLQHLCFLAQVKAQPQAFQPKQLAAKYQETEVVLYTQENAQKAAVMCFVLFCFVSVLLNQLHKLANITSLSCTGNRKVVVIVSLWFNLRKAAKACVFSNLYSFQKG